MSPSYNPKTLAKTLAYILYHSPGEHGLFWDPDGTMPWKELYWVLQADPTLRFVRESHLKEIAYLGIDFPAVLDGKSFRLKEGVPRPSYEVSEGLPARLFSGCPRRRLGILREQGLAPTSRPWVVLFSDRELALRVGARRDPEAIVIEVLTDKAVEEGVAFRSAGGPLYVADAIPASCLLLPLMREDDHPSAPGKKKDKTSGKVAAPGTPGSYFMSPEHLQDAMPGSSGKDVASKHRRKGQRGPEWKRDARKERHKRNA